MNSIRNCKQHHKAILFIFIITTSFNSVSLALSGGGTESDPYLITSLGDFEEFASQSDYWDDYIRLESDIDLATKTYWTAVIAPDLDNSDDIGFTGTKFNGVFDGNNHTIYNLFINSLSLDNDYLGLFGATDKNGSIRNLHLRKAVIESYRDTTNGTKRVGSLCGFNYGTIDNCSSEVTITLEYSAYVGGLVGQSSGTIKNSNVDVNISVGDFSSHIGGIVGVNVGEVKYDPKINNCHSNGSISAKLYDITTACLGGLVGTNAVATEGSFSTIVNSSSCVDITASNNSSHIGGLVGNNQGLGAGIASSCASGKVIAGLNNSKLIGGLCGMNDGGLIMNSYSTGAVYGYRLVGGLCGCNQEDAEIFNCYSTGSVTGTSYTGGFCGGHTGEFSVLSNCFWNTETSGMTTGYVLTTTEPGYIDHVVGKTTDEMSMMQIFLDANWDFVGETDNGNVDYWRMPYAIGSPILFWEKDIRGDFVGDYGVDLWDYNVFAEDWLKTARTEWCKELKLTASDGAANDYFGYSVAINGEYAIVGAYGDDDKGSNSGSAYIVNIVTGEQIGKLTASDGAAEDGFGRSVAIDGEYAIVGAYGDDDKGSSSGSAYIVNIVTGEQIGKLTASDGAANDYFGRSVAIDGDHAIVGAYGDDDKGSNSGSAYIVNIVTGEQIGKLTASDGAANDYFGRSVAIDGDYAIVGADWDDDKGSSSGSAYIFNIVTGEQIGKLTASDGAADDYFGYSVAIDGDYAIVGASWDDNKGSFSIFNIVTGEQIGKLTAASDGAAEDNFGRSVAIDGEYAIVGAYGDDDKGSSSGSAYIFNTLTHFSQADLDKSGKVDIDDYLIFVQSWLEGI